MIGFEDDTVRRRARRGEFRAKILRLSPNQARTIFRDEPGVHDLANEVGKSRFFRKRSQLRIPHGVLTRFWNKTEIRDGNSRTQIARRRRV